MTNEIRNKIEAILFSCGNKISVSDISKMIGLSHDVVLKALQDLKHEYESMQHSLKILDENEMWKMTVRENYISLVRSIVTDTELPKAILETLAVIAWKAPLLQSDLIRLRNNKAYEHIAELENSGFINKERYGRSYKIKLAQKFYDYFDIENIKKLKSDIDLTAETAEKKALDKQEKKQELKITEKAEEIKEVTVPEEKNIIENGISEDKDKTQEEE